MSELWPQAEAKDMEVVRTMAKIYCRKIKGGNMSIDQVPGRWKNEVLALLEADQDKE